MRFRIVAYPVMDGYFITVTEFESDFIYTPTPRQHFTITPAELKVDDLQHLLEVLYMKVSEVTP